MPMFAAHRPSYRLLPILLLLGAFFAALPAAAITVSMTTDRNSGSCVPGNCSLREAIILANATPGPDQIDLVAGATYTLTIAGANEDASATGDLDITDDLTIQTPFGTGVAIIQAGATKGVGIDRVLHINPLTNKTIFVNMTQIHIKNGTTTGSGGGIYFDGFNSTNNTRNGSLTMDYCSLIDNQAAVSGGGLFAKDLSTCSLRLGSTSGSVPQGGVIGNIVTAGNGGGVATNNTNLLILDGQVNGFTANEASGNGGGVFLQGGTANGRFTRLFGIYRNNRADRDLNGTGDGGGIYNSADSTLSLIANDIGLGTGNRAVNGGGVANFGPLDMPSTQNNNVISQNLATGNGGGLYNSGAAAVVTMAKGSFQLNKADSDANGTGDGGAIYNNGGTITMTGGVLAAGQPPLIALLSQNTAANGGGLANVAGTVTISTGTIDSNRALTGSGGGVYLTGGTVSLCEIQFRFNDAAVSGGAIRKTAGTLTTHLSWFNGDSAPSASAIASAGTTPNLEDNWWGCDGFPNDSGCGTATGTIDADPRIDLRLLPTPGTIPPNAKSTLTADFTRNTNGLIPAACSSVRPSPVVLENQLADFFSLSGLGSVSGTPSTIVNGQATATFQAGATPGTAPVAVSVAGGFQQANVIISGAAPTIDLSLSKTSSTLTPNVGQNITFTVTLTNAPALTTATNVTVRDILPTGLNFVSATPSVGSYNNITGNWLVGSLNSGSSATLQVVATVASIGAKVNTAQVAAADQHDPDSLPNNNVAAEDDQASVTVTPQQADLSLNMTVNTTTPTVGTNVTFTITVSSAAGAQFSTATNVAVTDLLPPGLSHVSNVPSQGTYNSGTGVWLIGSIAPGASVTLTLTANVTSTGAKSNTAQVTAVDQADPDSAPNNNVSFEDDQKSITLNPDPAVADLSLVVSVDNASPAIGSNVTFTVQILNSGPNGATGVQVTDLLPAGLAYVGHTVTAGTYAQGSGLWNIGAFGNSSNATLTITATVSGSAPKTNRAEVTASDQIDSDSTPNNHVAAEDDDESVTVTPLKADLSVTKTATPATAAIGDSVTFTVTVTNAGPSSATNVSITDALGAGLAFTGAVSSQGSYNSGTGVWLVGTLNNTESATLDITATVLATGSKTNRAQVTAVDQLDPDSTPNNSVATEDDDASFTITDVAGSTFCVDTVIQFNTAVGIASPCDEDIVWRTGPRIGADAVAGTGTETSGIAADAVVAENPARATPYSSQLTVAGLSGPIISMTVKIRGFRHERPDDVDMMLVSPTGERAMIWSDAGGRAASQNFNTTGIDVILDDTAATDLPDDPGAQLAGGTYRPKDWDTTTCDVPDSFPAPAPAAVNNSVLTTPTGAFSGINPNGTWQLYIVDDEEQTLTAVDSSILHGWCLSFVTNQPPVATDDTLTVNEDSSNSVNVLTNDNDPDNDTMTVTAFTQGANGSVSCTAAGVCTYTPVANFSGTDSFDYTVSDGKGGTDTGTVNVTVDPVDDPPVAVDDTLTTNEDTANNVNVLTNDIEIDGETKSVVGNTQGAHGSVSCTSFGVCTYTPAANYFGPDSFDYTMTDGHTTDVGTVNVTVNPVNDRPVAVDDTVTTNEDTPATFNVLTNDTDPENDPLEMDGYGQPSHGSVTCDSAGNCTYTPDPNYFGPDSFDYNVIDGNDGDSGTVNITVNPIDDPPVAVDDTLTTNEDTPGSVDVVANDTEIDGDPKSVTAFTQGAHGSVSCTTAGVCSYTPNANYFGPDSFDYTLSDTHTTDVGTVNVTVNSVNDPPVAVDDTLTTNEDTPNSVNVLANDTDVENDSRTVTAFTQGAHGSVSCTAAGVCTYTPNANYFGPDTFDYTVTDANSGADTGTVNVTVNPVNDPPVAVDDTLTTNEDTPGSVDVVANDTEIDGDPKSVTGFTQGAHGSVSCTTAGVCTYTPNANYFGPDSFDYTLSDTHTTDVGTVNVTVNSVNDPPVAVDDTLTTNEDTPNSVNVLANDTDVENDSRTVTAFTQGAHGSVSCTAAGVCTYTPNANYFGPDTFDYTVTDANSGADTGTVNVTVNPVNDPPVAVDDTLTTNEDTPGSVDVVANDTEIDGDPKSVTGFTQGAHGSVSCTTAGVCTYTPNANYFGPDSFDYTLSDTHSTDVGTVNVTVNSVNDPPVAVDDTLTTNEDTPNSVNVLANDTDVENDSRTVTAFTQGAHGSVSCTAAGVCTYTPNANYFGPDSFDYTVTDANSGADTGTVNVTVNPVNDPPVAVDDTLTTNEDTPGSVDVVANDTEIDGDPKSVTGFTQGAHGSVSCTTAGVCTYTPNANYFGPDSFDYTLSDTHSTDTGTVNVTVNSVNDPPVAVDDTLSVNEDSSNSVNVLANDTDVENDSRTVTAFTQGAHGTVNCTAAGICTYTPAANYNGPDTFDYTVTDANLGSDTGTVTVTVNPQDDPPVAVDDTLTTNEDTPGSVNVLTNDTDIDGDPKSVTAFTQGAHGSVSCTTAGVCTYTPNANYFGPDSFTYTLSDTHTTDVGTVNVTVNSVNDNPVAVDDTLTVAEDSSNSVDVLANDTDPENDARTVSAFTQGAHGSVSCTSAGICTYTPVANYNGPDSFGYTVRDANNGTDTGVVNVTVTPVNDPPVAVDDSYQAFRDDVLTVNPPGVLANDSDIDSPMTAQLVTPPASGMLSLSPNGGFTYVPAAGFIGTVSFVYRAFDGTLPSANATVTITVSEPPPSGPTALVSGSQTICAGNSATISATLTGTAPFTVTWSDGVTQTSGSALVTRSVSPATTTIYTITSISDATGAGSSFGGAIVTVTPKPAPPTITASASPVLGQPLTLTATGGGTSYQWYRDGQPIPGATGATYTIAMLTEADLGSYSVSVTNGGCTSARSAELAVETDLTEAILAVVGATEGANGSKFDTELSLYNPSDETMRGHIELLFVDGQTRSVNYEIAPHATLHLSNFLAGISGLASGNIVRTTGGMPMVLAHVYNDAGERGTFGMLQRARLLRDVLVRGDEAVLIAPANPVTTRFNVGVRTLGEGATLRIVVRDRDGAVLTTVDRSFPASKLTQQGAAALIDRPLGGSDSITFTVLDGRAVIYGAATDNATNDPNIQFASRIEASAGERYVIPVAGSTAGAFGSLFRTGVQLHNPGDSPMEARFILHPAGRPGAAGDPSLPLTVAPHATASIDDLLPAMAQTGLGTVDLVVISALRPIAAVRVFNDASDGQTSMTEELVATGEAIGAGSSGSILAPHDPTTARFNIGIRTLDAGVQMMATVRDASGHVVVTKTFAYPANQFVQVAAPELLGATLHGDESVTFQVTSGSAIIYGVWTDNRTQDPSFHYAAKP